MKSSKKNIHQNQEGIVAIVVTVIIMLITTLIVLAMSQGANREQRQALDRQLSNQAFYNAESGINDVSYYLFKYPQMADVADECGEFEANVKVVEPTSTLNGQLDGSTGSNKYTCALYDKSPYELKFQKVEAQESKVTPIQSADGSIIKELVISWDDSDTPTGPITGSCSFNSGSPELPPSCGYGGVRLDLLNAAPSREAISKLAFVAYLLPNATTGTDVSVIGKPYPDNQGVISAARCDTNPGPHRCRVKITDINLASFFVNMRSIYRSVDLYIEANNAAGRVKLKNSQVMIDVTGKSSDVLRRVQVRAPATAQYEYPSFGLQTKESICKLIAVTATPNEAKPMIDSNGNTCPIPAP